MPTDAPCIVWSGPLLDRSGFADEARTVLLALDDRGIDVRLDPFDRSWSAHLPSGIAERMERMLVIEPPDRFVHVVHSTPPLRARQPGSVLTVGRQMFETLDLPPGWAERCAVMDEIWVPSDFVRDAFVRSGVPIAKLHVLGEGLRPQLFDPSVAPIEELRGLDRFVFLSVFGWGRRKGWDVLVRAFIEEFRADEGVTLALKITPSFERTVAHHRDELETHIREVLGREIARSPRIVVLDIDPGDEGMAGVYRSADAFVLPSRGEAWGRPYMEAMAMGLPTIGPRWGGNLAFMTDDNSYLIECVAADVPPAAAAEWPLFRGRRWGEPSVEQLRSAMRRVVEHRDEARAKGRRARADILAKHTSAHVADGILARLAARGVEPARRPRPRGRRLAVTWQGPQFVTFGMAVVNRAMCRALIGTGRVDLEIRPGTSMDPAVAADPSAAALLARVRADGPRRADVRVRHGWPPDLTPVPQGNLVLIQPWEFGSLPKDWIAPMNEHVDEVWVPTRYVRDCYIRSGVDPAKVVVVPNGVDPLLFNPLAPPLQLPTSKRFRFLYVGGTIARKGADILLDTYLRTFRREDDVCLVVKDLGADTFYVGQSLRDTIRRAQLDARLPEILYLDDDMPASSMPSLYRACDCLVQPYRGEGFGLPIAEAMACGLPVIVTGHGAALDFCDPSVAYVVPAREITLDHARVGDLATVDHPWWAEIDRGALAAAMRRVVEQPQEARSIGARASRKVLRELTWAQAADKALERLELLASGPRSRARSPARRLSVCVIARDEERMLPSCLESIRDVADEIVLVDTGSSDRTVEIARSFGAQVHGVEWSDDFAAARNESLRHATGDWILVIDADQTLERASQAWLRQLAHVDGLVGFMVRQLNYVDRDGHTDVVEHLALRLFPNHADLRFVGPIHEQLVATRRDLIFHVAPSPVVLHHHGFRAGVRDRVATAERDRAVLERVVREEPGQPFHAFNLGMTYETLGRYEEAERELLRAISLCVPDLAQGLFPRYIADAYVRLARIALTRERPGEAAAYADMALHLMPDHADGHAFRGAALRRLGRPEEARRAYERALQCGDRAALAPTDRATAGWKAHVGIAEIDLALGRHADARTRLEKARAVAPDASEVREAFARLDAATGASAR